MGRGKGDSHFLMDVALPSAHKNISFPSAHKDIVISLPSAHVSQKVKATFFTLSNASLYKIQKIVNFQITSAWTSFNFPEMSL